jgi:V8-like Glu-specific endopeptidase
MSRLSNVVPMLAGLGLLGATMAAARDAGAQGAPTVIVNSDEAGTIAYWTPERLASAKPIPLPMPSFEVVPRTEPEAPPQSQITLPGSPPAEQVLPDRELLYAPIAGELDQPPVPFAVGSEGLYFTSSRLVDDAVAKLGAETDFLYAIEGRLFFTIPPGTSNPPGNMACSATVQTVGIITTAGHCTADGNGHLYKNWMFVPATRSGSAPFGKWSFRSVWVSNTWATGGGTFPNDQDVAVIVLSKNRKGKRIGNLTGFVGFNIPDLFSGQHVTVLGYPGNIDNGVKDHRTDAQAAGGSGNTNIIGANSGGGASGGGWLINYGQAGKGEPVPGETDKAANNLVAVTSYGPTPATPLYIGASILDSRYVQCVPLNTCGGPSASALLNIACENSPGAC